MLKTRVRKLTKVFYEAAKNASNALTKLSGGKAIVGVSKVKIAKIQRKFSVVEPETIVAGVYLPVTGEVKGGFLLIFPEKIAYALCDMLFGRKPDTTRRLTELDKSALKEVGNIICGSFLTVFSDTLKIKTVEHVPSLSFDMFGAVVDVIIAEFARKAEDGLAIELKLVFERHDNMKVYISFLLLGLKE